MIGDSKSVQFEGRTDVSDNKTFSEENLRFHIDEIFKYP